MTRGGQKRGDYLPPPPGGPSAREEAPVFL
jgi:hypothetical protein